MKDVTQFIIDNWKVLFGGAGTLILNAILVVVVTILAFFFSPLGNFIKGFFKGSKQPSPVSTTEAANTAKIVEALVTKHNTEIDQRDQTIESLSKAVEALAAEKNDPDAPEGIDEALACLEQGETNEAEDIFQKILETKETEGDAKETEKQQAYTEAAQAAMHIGALAYLHDTQKAMAAYKKATQLDPDDANAWNWLGGLLLRVGDLAGAGRALEKVLALGNATADKTTIAMATGNLGLIAKTRGDLDGAEDYHQRSLAIETELGRKEGMAIQLGNLGLIARTRGDLDLAEDYHQRSLTLATELGRREGMASQLGNLGLVAKARGDLDRAEDYHQRSLAIETELGRKEGMASELGNLGGVAALRGNKPEACRLLQEALDLFQTVGMPHMVEKVQVQMEKVGCDGSGG